MGPVARNQQKQFLDSLSVVRETSPWYSIHMQRFALPGKLHTAVWSIGPWPINVCILIWSCRSQTYLSNFLPNLPSLIQTIFRSCLCANWWSQARSVNSGFLQKEIQETKATRDQWGNTVYSDEPAVSQQSSSCRANFSILFHFALPGKLGTNRAG